MGVGGPWRAEVALLAEGVDRNKIMPDNKKSSLHVALLAEGVDRNTNWYKLHRRCGQSPSSRRAWIEMLCFLSRSDAL